MSEPSSGVTAGFGGCEPEKETLAPAVLLAAVGACSVLADGPRGIWMT